MAYSSRRVGGALGTRLAAIRLAWEGRRDPLAAHRGARAEGGRRKRAQTEIAAFDMLYGPAQFPAALCVRDGELIALNPAMAAETARDVEPESAADLLAAWIETPDSLVYRLLARATDEAASEIVVGPRGRARVGARPIGDGFHLWTVAPFGRQAAAGAQDTGHAFLEELPTPLARLTPEGEIEFINRAARLLLGPRARAGAMIGDLIEGLGRPMATRIAEAIRGDASGRPEIARADGSGRETFLQVSLTRLSIGREPTLVAVFADATELKTLEAQFVQSQKMQAVGQLAGGVAHDFNNLLTAISGHADLLLQRHEQGDQNWADLNQIRQNANRAAALVRQLLAFSRKQTLRPRVVNLAEALGEISHLLNRLLGERVRLTISHAPDLHLVHVDERQFEQVIMNLVVNARDAMKGEGEVRIRTRNERISAERHLGRAVMPRGDYVRIDVSDTGEGIPSDKIDQIFEPFFTTKKQGEGTGLGLSTVYGIVKQTGGFIFADSRPGEGATFTIYLPRHVPSADAAPAPRRAPPAAEQDLTGRGLVLLVEDEAPVRAFAARALKLRGYEVLEAASGEEALGLLEDKGLQVDVMISDVVMPGVDGPSCVREARKARPDLRVIFVSGYAEDAMRRSIEDVQDARLLPKPFSLNELTATVKEVLTA